MLRRIRKPPGKLYAVGDEIEARGYLVQGFQDDADEWYERARKDMGKGKVDERWFRLED